ncbi:MAG: hypothetical protein JSU73_14055 [candidate division WOR-3 bacterium]|nr:MAG: hypothetical protein JSU73_14055 [candidate division WOR-3 bacterium]
MKPGIALLAACAVLLLFGCGPKQEPPTSAGQAKLKTKATEEPWPSELWPMEKVSPEIPGRPGLKDAILSYLDHGAQLQGVGPVFSAYQLLGTEQKADSVIVYLWAASSEWSQQADSLVLSSGISAPIVLVALHSGGGYQVFSHRMPEEGEDYAESVRQLFPSEFLEDLFLTPGDAYNVRAASLQEQTRRRAWEYHKLK